MASLILVIASCALLTYIFWPTPSGNDVYASVYVSASLVKLGSEEKIDLSRVTESKDYVIKGKETELTITVKPNEIGVTKSGCSNQFCVHQGFISRPSQTIVCAPNELVISLRAVSNGEIEI